MTRIESDPHTAVEYIESYIKNSGYPVEAWDTCSAGELSEQGMDYALRAVNMARHGDATRGSRALFAREPQPSDASPATGIPRL